MILLLNIVFVSEKSLFSTKTKSFLLFPINKSGWVSFGGYLNTRHPAAEKLNFCSVGKCHKLRFLTAPMIMIIMIIVIIISWWSPRWKMLGLLTAAKWGTNCLSKNRFRSTEKEEEKISCKKNQLQKNLLQKKKSAANYQII